MMRLVVVLSVATIFLLGVTRSSQANTLQLTGIIRDFTPETNPDFEATVNYEQVGKVQSTLGSDKKPIFAGSVDGTFHGSTYFDQWYRDVPGVNLSTTITLTLTNSATNPNVYTYSNSNFFPIDNQLFGNYGDSGHNYHFTLECHSQFTYQGGEIFHFSGDDDLWVFINNKLAVDIGGIHPVYSASIDLDSMAGILGISKGNTYDIDIFFAERHTVASELMIETSVFLPPAHAPIPSTLLLMGSGLLGLAGWRRFRKG